jgi:hypothetical protein
MPGHSPHFLTTVSTFQSPMASVQQGSYQNSAVSPHGVGEALDELSPGMTDLPLPLFLNLSTRKIDL